MILRAYNTLASEKQEFVPQNSSCVTMYVCGPTVYNVIHIGNARAYIAFDAIRRYFEYKGYHVKFVRNITDVDDKIIKRAAEESSTPKEIARTYTQAFEEDMRLLGVKEADVSPKATEHIQDMVKTVSKLVERGYAYVVDGDVFFDVAKFSDYGKLSHKTIGELRAGERVEVDERKRSPLDFALWKSSKEGEPAWDSPWGKGRPGWHIECSAMSSKYLGFGFDIHGGGQDLIFPHHENEIAQAEAAEGRKPFVKYWLHNGFVNIDKEKMAKSVGNVVLVRDLANRYKGREVVLRNALRMLFLSTHYRSPIDFSYDLLREASAKVESLSLLVQNVDFLLKKADFKQAKSLSSDEKKAQQKISQVEGKFAVAMDDDFNTASAIAALFELEKELNTFIENNQNKLSTKAKEILVGAKEITIRLAEKVIGLDLTTALPLRASPKKLAELEEAFLGKKQSGGENIRLEGLVQEREEARLKKDFKKADEIRKRLDEIGVLVEDTPYGPRIKQKQDK